MRFLIAIALIALGLSPWLLSYVRLALEDDLYSYVLLIPAVSGYLIWQRRAAFETSSRPYGALSIIPAAAGLGLLALRLHGAAERAPVDNAALVALSFVLLVWAAALLLLGRTTLRALTFPLAFLLAMTPLPSVVEQVIETGLQHGSAECAYWMFRASGMTMLREGLIFHLPGMSMEVAPQCSGIRSTLVLFITSLVGGYLFLRSPWRRGVLTLAVIPLALLRNGFRVFTLGQLCVHVGPHMIDSPIHHQGGPIFFALSLIPFMGIVWLLMRGERKQGARKDLEPGRA